MGSPPNLSDIVSVMTVFYYNNSDTYFLRFEEHNNICKAPRYCAPQCRIMLLVSSNLIAVYVASPPLSLPKPLLTSDREERLIPKAVLINKKGNTGTNRPWSLT